MIIMNLSTLMGFVIAFVSDQSPLGAIIPSDGGRN